MTLRALIFDVDGTLAETEDTHLAAFNAAFAALGTGWHWDADLNRGLLNVSGGLARLRAYQARLPKDQQLSEARLAEIHALKTEQYGRLLAQGALELRPGIRPLTEAARDAGLRLAVVTASGCASLRALVQGCWGRPAEEIFDVVVTGDDVRRNKPDPEGYLLAMARLDLAAREALAFEDSPVGHAAARAAGLDVVVTPSCHGPQGAEYDGALVLPSLAAEFWPSFGFLPTGRD